MHRKFLIIFFVILSFFTIYGQQEIGAIYSLNEAEQHFGKVEYSIVIATEVMKHYLSYTNDVIMFKFYNGKLVILGDGRKLITSQTTIKVTETDEFRLFSKSKVEELLMKGLDEFTFIEIRKGAFTITNNAFTLENSNPCPPDCN